MRTRLKFCLTGFLLVVLLGCQKSPDSSSTFSAGNQSTSAVESTPVQSTPTESADPVSTAGKLDSAVKSQEQPEEITEPATNPPSKDAQISLAEARRGFKTKLARQESSHEPVEDPPSELFRTVKYPSPAGELAAYLTTDPGDGNKHPAIIWITGGDCNTIGDVWTPMSPDNDQSASAFRKAGMVMMFPSLRGGNENPGFKEGFFGEVDDVIAAADYLAKQEFVDPNRIYLGGHSTGGTLVLLVAECTDRFRAVFSFGPAANPRGYGSEMLPFDLSNPKEFDLRNPSKWLSSIRSQVFIFEGTMDGNSKSLKTLATLSKSNPNITVLSKKRTNHFSILAPTTELIARKLAQQTGGESLSITKEELNNE